MNLRTYHAYSMADALEAVKSDLGPDAVILHTRTFRRGGVLGIGAKQIVEVTAADALPTAEDATERVVATARSATSSTNQGQKHTVASVSATMADVIEARSSGAAETVSSWQARRAYSSSAATPRSRLHDASIEPAPHAERSSRPQRTIAAPLEQASGAASQGSKVSSRAGHAPVVSVSPTAQHTSIAHVAGDRSLGKEMTVTVARSRPAGSAAGLVRALGDASAPADVPANVAEPVVAPKKVVPPAMKPFVLQRFEPASIETAHEAKAAPTPDAALQRTPAVRIIPVGQHAGLPSPPAHQATEFETQQRSAGPRAAGPASQSEKQAPMPSLARKQGDESAVQVVQDELAAIRDMVGQVLQRQVAAHGNATPGVPKQLFDMYLQLISHDLAEELADEVVSSVAKSLPPDCMDDDEAVRLAVLHALAEHIPVAPQREIGPRADGRPLTIALVGPTGVGKTTTLAKMAATFKLHEQKSVGMVTCDTYRIAAVDQLTTYARIIGVPLRVVRSPDDMRVALAEFTGCDVVLIDTAGRGQRDSDRLEELREMVQAAQPHEVHLVLSSTASEKVMLSEAEAFSPVGADTIVLTKLDEAVSFGMLVNVLKKVGKKLSFVTTGQEVPDHFERGDAARLAQLVLGTATGSP